MVPNFHFMANCDAECRISWDVCCSTSAFAAECGTLVIDIHTVVQKLFLDLCCCDGRPDIVVCGLYACVNVRSKCPDCKAQFVSSPLLLDVLSLIGSTGGQFPSTDWGTRIPFGLGMWVGFI